MQETSVNQIQTPEKKPPVQQKPRWVGWWTLGCALILTGVVLFLHAIVPSFNLLLVAQFAPLLLVVLGAEILWYGHKYSHEKVRVSILSAFICAVLIGGSLLAGAAGQYWQAYFSPATQAEQLAFQEQEEKRLVSLVQDQPIKEFHVWADWAGDTYMYLVGQVSTAKEPVVNVSLQLSEPVTDITDFATKAQKMAQFLHENQVDVVWVKAADAQGQVYSFTFMEEFDFTVSPEFLAERVELETPVDYYDQIYNDGYEAGFEEGKAQGFQEGAEHSYQEGYDTGFDMGQEEGFNQGSENGYQQGYDTGHNRGWEEGYQQGIDRGGSQMSAVTQ